MTDSNTNDPSNYLPNGTSQPQTLVKIQNTSRNDINGSIGLVLSYSPERNRYTLNLLPGANHNNHHAAGDAAARRAGGGDSGMMIALKPENLIELGFVEKMKTQFEILKYEGLKMWKDPETQRKVRDLYEGVQNRMPHPALKPEYLLGVLGLVLVLMIRALGFMKMMMLTSILLTMLIVCFVDIKEGKDVKTIVKNFPLRWRNIMAEATGYRNLSLRMSMVAFILLLVFSGKVIFTSAPKGRPVPSTPPKMTVPDPIPSESIPPKVQSMTMEEIYRLGYDDANSDKPFGTSLPDSEPTDVFTRRATSPGGIADGSGEEPYPPLDWNYAPPPKKSSKFGFTTIMSLVAVGRTGYEIFMISRGPDGTFDPELAMANIRNLEPFKLVILGLSLYRVLSTFLF